MKKCEEIREQISLYIDKKLDEKTLDEFEEHIDVCEDCRKELYETEAMLDLYLGSSDEDLPESFGEELHKKLVAEKENMEERNKRIAFFGKCAGILSSAAALLMIAFICKGIWFNTDGYKILSENPTPFSKTEKNINKKSNTEQSAKDIKEKLDQESSPNPSDNTNNGEIKQNIANNAYDFGTQPTQNPRADSLALGGAATPDRKSTSSKTGGNDTGAAQRGPALPESCEPAQIPVPTGGASATGYTLNKSSAGNTGDTSVENIDILLFDNDPSAQIGRLEKYAADCEGEVIESNMPELRVTSSDADSVSSVIRLKVKEDECAKFVNLLQVNYDSKNLSIELPEKEDINAKIDELNKISGELDKNINQAENSGVPPDSQELNDMLSQKEQVDKEINGYLRNEGYTFITIYFKGK